MDDLDKSDEFLSSSEKDFYSNWSEAFKYYDHTYGWKPYETTTHDGYIITAFNIFKKEYCLKNQDNPTSVIYMPGLGTDVSREINLDLQINPSGDSVWWFHLLEAGYDVWLANFRGS